MTTILQPFSKNSCKSVEIELHYIFSCVGRIMKPLQNRVEYVIKQSLVQVLCMEGLRLRNSSKENPLVFFYIGKVGDKILLIDEHEFLQVIVGILGFNASSSKSLVFS